MVARASFSKRQTFPGTGSWPTLWQVVPGVHRVASWSDQPSWRDIFLLRTDVSDGEGHCLARIEEAGAKGLDQEQERD